MTVKMVRVSYLLEPATKTPTAKASF